MIFFYQHAKFHSELTLVVLGAKRRKSCSEKSILISLIIVSDLFFYTEQHECCFTAKPSMFVKNLYMFITKKVKNFFRSFTIFLNFLIGAGACAPGCTLEFPYISSLVHPSLLCELLFTLFYLVRTGQQSRGCYG